MEGGSVIRLETRGTPGTNNLDYTLTATDYPVPTILAGSISSTQGKKIWLNSLSTVTTSPTQTNLLNSAYSAATIGRYITVNYGAMDICELIFYERALMSEEIVDVLKYLSKKYNIKIS